MPIGVIIDAASVALGGILGALAGHKLPENLKVQLNIVLGLCSMGMGISAVGLMKNMPAVIFAIVLGSGIGLAVGLGGWINRGAEAMQRPVARLLHSQNSSMSQEEFTATLVTVIVLFCASGTGIYGSLDAGMTGDSTILISKSILDLFTAAVFACNLGYVVSLVALPHRGPPVRGVYLPVLRRKGDLPADHSRNDPGFQGLRRFPDGGHRPADDQDQSLPHCGHDPGHGAGHAVQLAVEQLHRTLAGLMRHPRTP